MNNYLWANSYWYFFHCFSYNLNTDLLTKNNIKLINLFINRILYSIPCEKCKIDSVNYFDNNNFNSISTKEQYILFFYKFHNYVNKKIRKEHQPITILKNYKNVSCLEYLRKIDSVIFKNKLNKQIYKFFIIITN